MLMGESGVWAGGVDVDDAAESVLRGCGRRGMEGRSRVGRYLVVSSCLSLRSCSCCIKKQTPRTPTRLCIYRRSLTSMGRDAASGGGRGKKNIEVGQGR
jgi:hypothetical protein